MQLISCAATAETDSNSISRELRLDPYITLFYALFSLLVSTVGSLACLLTDARTDSDLNRCSETTLWSEYDETSYDKGV